MNHYDDFEVDGRSQIIGLMAAALSGAFVGMVAGAMGAVFAMLTWSAS
jgi:hypothetical protein